MTVRRLRLAPARKAPLGTFTVVMTILVLAWPAPLFAQNVKKETLVGSWREKGNAESVLTLRADNTLLHKNGLRSEAGDKYDLEALWRPSGDTLVISPTGLPTGGDLSTEEIYCLIKLEGRQLTLTRIQERESTPRIFERVDSVKVDPPKP